MHKKTTMQHLRDYRFNITFDEGERLPLLIIVQRTERYSNEPLFTKQSMYVEFTSYERKSSQSKVCWLNKDIAERSLYWI